MTTTKPVGDTGTGPDGAPRSTRIDRSFLARVAKYTTGSVVAAVTSEVVFLIMFGPLGAWSSVSTIVAFWAGAIPNYILNRRWAWQRTGKAHRRELIRYWAVVFLSLGITIAFTWVGARIAHQLFETRSAQTFFVGGVYLFANGVVFLLKYYLFDRYVFIDHGARATRSRTAP
jgi:putative flippase GtrA